MGWLVGWYEERNAGKAIAALKKEPALKATVGLRCMQ